MAIGIGETLRAARRERGATLPDAAAATRIRQRYLAALEEDDFEALGEDVYVRGFLRSYANYLELDATPLLAQYRASFERDTDHAVAVTPAVPPRNPLPRPVRAAAAAGTLVLLLAAVAVAGDRGRDATPAPAPTVGAELTRTPATPSPTPLSPAPASPPPAVPTVSPTSDPQPVEGLEVGVRVSGAASWVRVTVDGAVVLEGTLADGASRTFRGEEQVVLRLGNAGAVLLTVNGEEIGPAGAAGEVLDLAFTPAAPGEPDEQ